MPRSPEHCVTADELLDAARLNAVSAPRSLEYNFPATCIMSVGAALENPYPNRGDSNPRRLVRALETCESSAECGMLQTAFLNHFVKPSASFVTIAEHHGWRFRIDVGFFRVDSYGPTPLLIRLRRWLALKLWA